MKKQLYLKLLTLLLMLSGLLVACGDSSATVGSNQVGTIPTATGVAGPTVTNLNPTPSPAAPGTTVAQPPSTPAPTKSTGNNQTPTAVQLATPFKLKFGQVARLGSENMEISLSHIEEDSRCPQKVECVVSGQLIVSVNVTKDGQSLGSFEINNIEAQRKKDKPTFINYNLALLGATPGRVFSNFGTPNAQVNPLKAEDYVMELVVTKLDLSSVPADQAVIGRRVQLKYGQTARYAAENMTVKFSILTKDFRCPKSDRVACATSGEASIELSVIKNGTSAQTLSLTIPGLVDDTSSRDAGGSVGYITTFEGYNFQLISLEPQPVYSESPTKASPESYIVTLVVTKKA